MSETQYLAPKTIEEAVKAHSKANGSARFLAGGTDFRSINFFIKY